MSRSLKKGPHVDERLYRRVERLNQQNKREPLKTWSRDCTVVPEFVGHTFKVRALLMVPEKVTNPELQHGLESLAAEMSVDIEGGEQMTSLVP